MRTVTTLAVAMLIAAPASAATTIVLPGAYVLPELSVSGTCVVSDPLGPPDCVPGPEDVLSVTIGAGLELLSGTADVAFSLGSALLFGTMRETGDASFLIFTQFNGPQDDAPLAANGGSSFPFAAGDYDFALDTQFAGQDWQATAVYTLVVGATDDFVPPVVPLPATAPLLVGALAAFRAGRRAPA